ncbi:cysteine-rich repeat secretory protein 11-like [Chenopodium quinoa]|uniref:cysteine-rich repeat secretory protein 11-like n=1 Tax=Chenopodium quinoa TaxID=63459 RepID=UPI000B796B96|nr:cysteine-rich repeat secretory protein 11-like [Chenopodium quinoa]
MGYYSFILILLIFTILYQTQFSKSAPDYTTLVYKGCSRQPISDPSGSYAQSLSSLFSSLLQQSSRSKFYKSTSGGSQSSISGLFQCRGDLSNADCYNCVSKLPQLSDQLCGKVTAARVQLLGCYMLFEVSGFTQISGMQMLFKDCSRTNVAGAGFEMKRDSALTVMENGVASSGGNGFYTTNYQAVYALGQCQGDLSSTDCTQCVKAAVQKAQIECGSSLAGQVYLHKCFISYNYYPNGVPKSSTSSWSGGSPGSGQTTGKTVAIIVGVTAGVAFLIILVLFVRGLKKKDDDF